MSLPILSPEAASAFAELMAGRICVPSEAVVSELGRFGLAYRRDLRSRSRRIALTLEGSKFISGSPSRHQERHGKV